MEKRLLEYVKSLLIYSSNVNINMMLGIVTKFMPYTINEISIVNDNELLLTIDFEFKKYSFILSVEKRNEKYYYVKKITLVD